MGHRSLSVDLRFDLFPRRVPGVTCLGEPNVYWEASTSTPVCQTSDYQKSWACKASAELGLATIRNSRGKILLKARHGKVVWEVLPELDISPIIRLLHEWSCD